MATFSLVNEIKSKLPSIDFHSMKTAVLGTKYDLSLIIVETARMKKLNTIYRDKETATDILSFPLTETEGEIYISPDQAKIEAKKFGRPYENFLAFLFIHGCVHLKGYDHGSTMERIEQKIRDKFKI